MKKNIAVIIRVHSRIDDVLALIHIIRQKWQKHTYTLFVVHNGIENGYLFPENTLKGVEYIVVQENSGHRTGARDLILTAYPYIDSKFDYAVFIEADFWVLHDDFIQETIDAKADIGTCIWIESRRSLAVDFFVIQQEYLANNKQIFNWGKSPETDFANAIYDTLVKIHLFQSLRLVHVPSSMRWLLKCIPVGYSAKGGRFRLFTKAKALTHHVEDLKGGIRTKKAIANQMEQDIFSNNNAEKSLGFFEKHIQRIAKFFPQSAWIKPIYWRSLYKNNIVK